MTKLSKIAWATAFASALLAIACFGVVWMLFSSASSYSGDPRSAEETLRFAGLATVARAMCIGLGFAGLLLGFLCYLARAQGERLRGEGSTRERMRERERVFEA